MTFSMKRISIPPADLDRDDFDVIVIGSGYGGSIAAARLAGKGINLCLLERGREILPGSYPTRIDEVAQETEIVTAKAGALDPDRNAMMQLRLNDDMQVVLGNGLGGGSLINAGVALEPDARVFDKNWPASFRSGTALDPFYDTVKTMLGSTPLPDEYNPPKLQALEVSAKKLGQPFERPPINVTFKDGPNHAGVMQAACTMCGDCCAGCNYGAKNTLLMNYLPTAHARGATIVTEAEAYTVGQKEDGTYTVTMIDRSSRDRKRRTLSAKRVIVSAGSIGSTEILQRSAAKTGLKLPAEMLGKRFSGNGDVLGFGFMANFTHTTRDYDEKTNTPPAVYGIGAGSNPPNQPQYRPGPCITGLIRVNMDKDMDIGTALVIEEGSPPGALSAIYPATFAADDVMNGAPTIFRDMKGKIGMLNQLKTDMEDVKSLDDMSALSYTGALARSQSFLVMSHDTSGGKLVYNGDDDVDVTGVEWPGVGTQQPYPRDNDVLEKAADAIWATYLPNPLWTSAMGDKLVTVHPVGGCVMGDSPETGVVNEYCQAWTGEGDALHPGLFVCDGAVIPTSLGLNPLLTISAITERAMDHLLKHPDLSIVADTETAKPENSGVLDPGVSQDVVKDILEYLDFMHDKLTEIAKECSEAGYYHPVVSGECAYALWTIMTKLGYDGWDQATFTGKMAKAFWDNDLKNDFGPACTIFANRIESVADAGRNPPDGTSPILAMGDAVQKAFGDLTPGLWFDETMTGTVGPKRADAGPVSDPYRIAAAAPAKTLQKIVGDFTIKGDHADLFWNDHPAKDTPPDAKLTGTVHLTDHDGTTRDLPITGTFNLLKADDTQVERWLMTYVGDLSEDYHFHGQKILQRREGSNYFADVTTLFVDLTPKDGSSAPALQGVMTLGIQELAKQAGTFKGGFVTDETFTEVLDDLERLLKENGTKQAFDTGSFLHTFLAATLARLSQTDSDPGLSNGLKKLSEVFQLSLLGVFGKLIFRTYGGVAAYLADFTGETDVGKVLPDQVGDTMPGFPDIKSTHYPVTTADNKALKLYRFKGGTKGPVILAPGFATTSFSYAMLTNGSSLTAELLKHGFDVWLFDYRSGPFTQPASKEPFTLDDIAQYDWPAGVDKVLDIRKAEHEPVPDVQILAHCAGSMTLQMALLGGYLAKDKVRQIVSSQLTVHPVTNWFNMMKSDTTMARLIINGLKPPLPSLLRYATGSEAIEFLAKGLKTINMNHYPDDNLEPPTQESLLHKEIDQIIDMVCWDVPFPYAEKCYSPCCHRLFGVYGPIYRHENLNEATHNAVKILFGEISTIPFEQLALCMRKGHAVNAAGQDVYLPNVGNLDLPIHFIAGALNLEFLPDTSLRTLDWLRKSLPKSADKFTRKVYPGYAHMDFFMTKYDDNDIYPDIADMFDLHATPTA